MSLSLQFLNIEMYQGSFLKFFLFSIHSPLLQFPFHGFKYHLHAFDVYIYVSCLHIFPELQYSSASKHSVHTVLT